MRRTLALTCALLVLATPAAGMPVNGELKRAQLENLSADPSATDLGRVYYNSTSNGAKIWNGTAWTSLGGAGSGEKNYIVNGASSATGWTASGAGLATPATDSTAVDIPEPLVGTALKLTGASGSSAYAFYNFTLDAGDYNKKLKTSFFQACGLSGATSTIANCAASDFKVDVYSCTVAWSGSPATTCSGTSTRLALSTDSSAVSALPALTGQYRTTFDSPGSAAPYLQLRVGMNTTQTHAIALSSVTVGPGVVTQGAAVTGALAYTPTFVGFGTVSTVTVFYQRVGDHILEEGTFTAGTVAASLATVTLPNSYTTTSGFNATYSVCGKWERNNASATTRKGGPMVCAQNSAVVYFSSDDYTAAVGPQSGINGSTAFSNGDLVTFQFNVPVNELAGSGTVNVVQNDCDYASNSSASNANDTTSFAYGQSGSLIPPVASSTKTYRVRWLTPIQKSDQISLLYDHSASGEWATFEQSIIGNALTATQGVQWFHVGGSSTDIDVSFGSAGYAASPQNAAGAWSTVSTSRWMAKKCAGGQAVGFSNATGTQAGLIAGSGTQTIAPRVSAGNSKARVHVAAASASVTCGTNAAIAFDTAEFDTNSEFAANKFTPTHSGYYLVNLDCDGGGSNSTAFQCEIYKNGTGGTRVCATSSGPAVGSANNEWQQSCSTVVNLNGSTDYIQGAVSVSGTGCLYYGGTGGSTMTITEVL